MKGAFPTDALLFILPDWQELCHEKIPDDCLTPFGTAFVSWLVSATKVDDWKLNNNK